MEALFLLRSTGVNIHDLPLSGADDVFCEIYERDGVEFLL